jgi:hypothetical protein
MKPTARKEKKMQLYIEPLKIRKKSGNTHFESENFLHSLHATYGTLEETHWLHLFPAMIQKYIYYKPLASM